jgi:predicted transcriptional regulator
LARNKSPHLTDAELRLMDVLCDKGPSTVAAVAEQVSVRTPLAYSTVLTTLRILENKGFVKHVKDGRAFVYRAIVARDKAQSSAVTHILSRFFADSPEQLLLNLVQSRKISAKELDRLRKRIEEES